MNPARNGGLMRGVAAPAREATRRQLLFEAFWERLSLGLVGVNGWPPKNGRPLQNHCHPHEPIMWSPLRPVYSVTERAHDSN
jgi:hypothetical protein